LGVFSLLIDFLVYNVIFSDTRPFSYISTRQSSLVQSSSLGQCSVLNIQLGPNVWSTVKPLILTTLNLTFLLDELQHAVLLLNSEYLCPVISANLLGS